MLYRRKPLYVEAFCWVGNQDPAQFPQWVGAAIKRGDLYFNEGDLVVKSRMGDMMCRPGDYLVKLLDSDEVYPYIKEVFEWTYERVHHDVGASDGCGTVAS